MIEILNMKKMRDFAEKIYNRDIEYGKRLKTLEGHQSNEDLSIEKEISNGAIEKVKSIGQDYKLPFTYKTGRNFISNIAQPYDNNKLITNFDGCYILSNTPTNAKVENIQKPNLKMQSKIKTNINLHTRTSINIEAKPQDRAKNLELLKKNVKMIQNEQNAVELLNKQKQSMIATLQTIPIKRMICIIEAKFYVSKEYIDAQKQKMHNLIDYFTATNLYYIAKEQNKFDIINLMEKWTSNFDKTCKQFNMQFDGIIIIIGGPYSSKIIDILLANMKEQFYIEFENKKKELQDKIISFPTDNNKYDDLRFIYQTKLNYVTRLIIDFDLLITTGNRFINIKNN